MGEYLFGEIGEPNVKISNLPTFLKNYRQIKSLPNCDIFQSSKYNSCQHFLFYSISPLLKPAKPFLRHNKWTWAHIGTWAHKCLAQFPHFVT